MEVVESTTLVEPAILVRGISKQYGSDPRILDDLDMTVTKGTIYALLGASGCGKTTLLGAILGSRKIQKGAISILGKAPGVVPVKSIGYMPQELALIEEFTIKRMIRHQGWIFGMTDKQIEERHQFYEKLLDLPPGNKLIKNLSGGQQRRVSLAVVLIQDPELLILDEPTVGLDPVLRQNLWDYLVKLTTEEKKTVVITTHYIEEARQANMVGLLRHGKMLAEGEPQTLMNQFNCDSLENLFISLSLKQEERDPSISNIQNNSISKSDELEIFNQKPPKKSLVQKICFTNRGHAKALMAKNIFRFAGHPAAFLMVLIIPLVQIFAVFTAIGRVPSDMNIGVVNQELGEYKNCEDYVRNHTVGGHRVDEFGRCEYDGLGCKFVEQFQNVIPNQIYYESIEDAMGAIKTGKIHQILFFPHNYSEAYTVVNNFHDVTSEEIDFSNIDFYRDEIDNPINIYVERELHTTYIKFAEELAKDCKWNVRSAKLPMIFNEPIYGTNNFELVKLLAAGTMMLTLLTLSMTLAIDTIISEKVRGVWERTIISGVQPAEIIVFHMITLCFVSAIQTGEAFFFSYYVFDLECEGNILNALLLLYLQVLVGVAQGIFFSVISRTEFEANFLALGSALPLLLLSGYVWPLEGMQTYLRYLSYALPTALPIESFTNILFRGWGITNLNVFKGYLVTSGYICLFLVACVFGLKFDRK